MNEHYRYNYLATKIKYMIFSHQYAPGEKMPPIRALAEINGCNPLTVQRAINILMQLGLIVSRRGIGHFVTQDEALIENYRSIETKQLVANFISNMRELGYSDPDIFRLTASRIKE